MPSKLPTSDQILKAAASDESKLRCALIEALDYAMEGDDGTNLESKTREAADVLLAVWEEEPEIEPSLVDAFWLQCTKLPKIEKDKETVDPKLDAITTILAALLQVEGRDSFRLELQSLLDVRVLEKVKVIEGRDVFTKKMSVVNTNQHFRQTKYNLLHEESQGFAKLLKLLLAGGLEEIKSLKPYIGAFDLDPNRVLDLLVDVLEVQKDRDNIMRLMKDFSTEKLPVLFHFKLTSYQKEDKPIPKSFYEVLVLLAKNSMLDLSLMTSTSWSEIDECHKLYVKAIKLQIREMNKVSLAGGGGKGNIKLAESRKELEDATAKLESGNTLIGLLTALLDMGEWDSACQVLQNQQDDWTKLCTLLPMKIGTKLCDHVSNQISPVYKDHVVVPNLVGKKPGENGNTKNQEKEDGEADVERTSVDEFFSESCSVSLIALAESGCLSTRPLLYSQLCRLAKVLLEKSESKQNPSSAALALFKSVLVPTLSLCAPNPAISADLWAALSVLPYATRYRIYNSWRGGGLERWGMESKPLLQVQSEIKAGKDARYSLKRLSKDNITDMGRQISKVTHSNPLVVFSAILNQIESYDNMIEMMVDSLRFVTPLGLDVLGYCIVSRLSGNAGSVNRSRLKDDGVNVSQWLQSLESFTGEFYKKFSDVEFRGILCYLQHRLKEGHVLELGILKSLIKTAGWFSFADYSPTSSLSVQQLEGKAGSQRLNRETFAFGIVAKYNVISAKRVKSVLQGDGMGITILICLAQIRSRLVFECGGVDHKHIKLVGNLLDTCQVVMSILLEFITADTDSPKDKKENDDGEVVQTSIQKYASALPPLGELFEKYGIDPVSAWMLARPLFKDPSSNDVVLKAHSLAREPIIRKMLPEAVFSHITPSLYNAFFTFSLSDLYFPAESYETESTRLKKEVERLNQKQTATQPTSPFTMEDEMDLERCRNSSQILKRDAEAQKKRCQSNKNKISSKKSSFMVSDEVSLESARLVLQHCTSPRCTISPQDAIYSAKFVELLHEAGTPGFSTLHYFDELVSMVTGSLYRATEDEAAAIGVTLLETWKLVSHWRYDEGAYEKEVVGKPGSFMISGDSSKPASVDFDAYKKLYNKWHAAIGKAVLGCFQGSVEYMHLRACFVILNRIVDEFPTRPKLGEELLKAIGELQDETYPLQDIKTAAQAYGSLLVKARNSGAWKEEDAKVAKARRAKEKEAAEKQIRRREEQMAEMAKDMKKIEAEIGDSDRFDDRRQRHGRVRFRFVKNTVLVS